MLDLVLVYVLLGVAVLAASLAVWLWLRSRRQRREIEDLQSPLSRNNLRRLRTRLRAVAPLIPRRASLTYCDFPAIEATATIEAWLLQQKPRNALAAARLAVRADPRDWRVRLHLARTLFYCDEMEAAARELVKARLLGDTSPAQDYLEARIRLASAQLSVEDELEEPEDIEHRIQAESAEALDMLLTVVERDPRFCDAAFHAGLLALRIGLEPEGRTLLTQLQPLMETSPERDVYQDVVKRFN